LNNHSFQIELSIVSIKFSHNFSELWQSERPFVTSLPNFYSGQPVTTKPVIIDAIQTKFVETIKTNEVATSLTVIVINSLSLCVKAAEDSSESKYS
jgi:hypothetical protein